MIRLKNLLKEAPKKKSLPLESLIVSGHDFKSKYATDFKGKVAKVLYKKTLNIGSNMGKGFYYNVTQDSLDIYSGKRDKELHSKYGMYVYKIIYKQITDNLKIFVQEGVAWDLEMGNNKDKLYESLKSMADGVYDPDQDDYGLLMFKDLK